MLVKGCRGSIIRLKSTGNRLFDEAFFVLREDATDVGERDIMREANRLLEENMLPERRRVASSLSLAIFFSLGFLAASLAWMLVLFLIFA